MTEERAETPLIRLRDLTKTYRIGEDISVPVLKGITLDISSGEYVSLMGASGSGKSTLMNILGCLDHATSGQYLFEGEDVTFASADRRAEIRNRKIGFVFQNFNLLPRTTALENVLMPLSYSSLHLSSREQKEKAETLLVKVGLKDRMKHTPSQLSGGQQQRVAIARALINDPPVLFADEPTGNLDSHTSVDVMEMFEALHENRKITVILVTHSPEIAKLTRRIIHLSDGMIQK